MECSCSHKENKATLSTGNPYHNPEEKKEMAELSKISKQKVIESDKFTLLKLALCVDRQSFEDAFSPFLKNARFDEKNIRKLAALWENGNDKKIGLDMDRIFGSINVNLKRLAVCQIKWEE